MSELDILRQLAEMETRLARLESAGAPYTTTAAGGMTTPALNVGSASGATTGQVRSSADMFPDGALWGVMDRISDVGVTSMEHFRTTIAPAGYSWQGAPFATPGSVVQYGSDYLGAYHAGASRGFFAKTVSYLRSSDASFIVRARIVTEYWLDAGLRVDDGTDNNYFETRIVHLSGPTAFFRMVQRTGGGAVTTTDTAAAIVLGDGVVLVLYLLALGGSTWSPRLYINNEVGAYSYINAGTNITTFDITRAGLVVDGTGRGMYDWMAVQ